MMQSRHRAFTLIEVLIAILLILAIGAGAFSLFSQIAAAREHLSDHLIRRRGLDALTRELERAVAVCYAGGREGIFRGTDSKIEIPCRVVRLAGAGTSPLLGHILSIRFDESKASILGATAGGPESVMVEHVAKLQIKYFDGRNWLESFDASTSGGLPSAIEVSVWWRSDNSPADESLAPADADAQLVIAVPDAGKVDGVSMTSPLRGTHGAHEFEMADSTANQPKTPSLALAKTRASCGGAA